MIRVKTGTGTVVVGDFVIRKGYVAETTNGADFWDNINPEALKK